jgi:hypothetical protein
MGCRALSRFLLVSILAMDECGFYRRFPLYMFLTKPQVFSFPLVPLALVCLCRFRSLVVEVASIRVFPWSAMPCPLTVRKSGGSPPVLRPARHPPRARTFSHHPFRFHPHHHHFLHIGIHSSDGRLFGFLRGVACSSPLSLPLRYGFFIPPGAAKISTMPPFVTYLVRYRTHDSPR